MPIGTAQPSSDQLHAVEHHFIASHNITQEFNCGAFESAALQLLETLFRRGRRVVAVGGSGLYVRALCEGMDDLPQADGALRRELMRQLETEGVEALAERLKRLDPVYYGEVDLRNPARVLRAVEVCLQTGRPFSSQRTGLRKQRPFDIVKIGVTLPREELYARIDRRSTPCWRRGLEEEARRVLPYRSINARQTVGYREFFDYFDGTITRDEAITLIKRNSRRYAKRQLTWFRRDAEIRWFSPFDTEGVIAWIDTQSGAGGVLIRWFCLRHRRATHTSSRGVPPLAPRVFHLVIAVAERIDGRADDVHDVVVGRGLRVEHPLAERLVHDDLRCGKRDASLLLRQQGRCRPVDRNPAPRHRRPMLPYNRPQERCRAVASASRAEY